MTIVNKTAETLKDGISNMMAGAKEDYFKWSSCGDGQSYLIFRLLVFRQFYLQLS
jgi:hypothetical protein